MIINKNSEKENSITKSYRMPKILIVEDELQMARALKDNFEMEGHEVELLPVMGKVV